MAKAENTGNKQKVDKRKSLPQLFKPGQSGNPNGRPPGSISIITRVKQIFQENPKQFESFVRGYVKDERNRKHIVEMIDGKAKQEVDLSGNLNLSMDPEKKKIIEKAIDDIL